MKKRVAESLKEFGYEGTVEEFRRVLADIKAELYPELSIDEFVLRRDEPSEYCKAVRRKLTAPKLTRVFILRCLIGIRKIGKKGRNMSLSGRESQI